MFASKKDGGKQDFRIKLLSGNNIILVEADGYESELFIPCISGGRIEFQNIIPSRRGCHVLEANDQPKQLINRNEKHKSAIIMNQETPHTLLTTVRKSVPMKKNYCTNEIYETRLANPSINANIGIRETAGQDKNEENSLPIACSTPANNSHPIAAVQNAPAIETSGLSKYTLPSGSMATGWPTGSRSTFSKTYQARRPIWPASTLTPQLARCEPITTRSAFESAISTPNQVMKKMLAKKPTGIKVARLHRSPTGDKPNHVGRRLGRGNTSITPRAAHRSPGGEEYSLQLPPTPKLKRRSARKSTLRHHTQSSLQKCVDLKWRKCITPVRTYSRRTDAAVQRHASNSSIKKPSLRSKHLSTYMVNSTQGTKGTHKVDIRRRKLIFDTKSSISPTSFKQQQLSNGSTVKNEYLAYTKLPKTRQEYERSKYTAFDILTNSNRAEIMSNQLNQQFRKGCINKGTSTNPKYKLLCTLPSVKDGNDATQVRRQPHKTKAPFGY